MKRNLRLIIALLSIFVANYSYGQETKQKHVTHTIIHHTNVRYINPNQVSIEVPCLTNDNVNISVTCIITFNPDFDKINTIDTLKVEELIFKTTRHIRSDSLSSQRCLNELGWNYQQYFKTNKQIKFIRYAIEFDPNNYKTETVTH